MLTASDVKKLKAALRIVEREKKKISASRDRLRDCIYDIQGLVDDIDDAVGSLEYGADALSRQL
jgi:hypothetical protein